KGSKFGHDTLVDGMVKDWLWGAFNDFKMGNYGEICADIRQGPYIDVGKKDLNALLKLERCRPWLPPITEYGVIEMVGLMIVIDAYHGCFHVFVSVRIGVAVGSICYLHAGNVALIWYIPSCGKCSLCSLDLPDGRPFNVELKSISTLEMTMVLTLLNDVAFVRQLRASLVLVSKAYDSPLQPKMAYFSSQSIPKESDAALVSENNVKNQELGYESSKGCLCTNLRHATRPFPASESGNGLPKWRMQSKDASSVPLTRKFLYVSVSMLDDGLILLE
nr:acetyl-CoA acetyltransferase, cytosolic 1-like [Tanacetum cinerariifolium]